MDDLQNIARGAQALFLGGLVVGDHNTLTVYGVDQQNELRECTRKLSRLMGTDNADACEAIASGLREIDRLERKPERRWGFLGRKKIDSQDSESVCAHIEQVSSLLEIQQARISKEVEILARLDASLQRCGDELSRRIDEGERVLENRPSDPEPTDENADGWYTRLAKRLDDLSVSQVVAQQSRAQIKILRENELAILDQISGFVFNLSSICRVQLAGEKVSETYKARLRACESSLTSLDERNEPGK